MLGKNLPLSEVVNEPWVNEPFLGIPALGTYGSIHIDTLALTWICMGFILASAALIVPTLTATSAGSKAQQVLEMVYQFVEDLIKGLMGRHYKLFLPLIAGIFMFVLTANFIGVGPWQAFEGWFESMGWHWPHIHGEPFEVASPTTDFNVTMGLATVSLIVYVGSGFWAHGAKYLKLYLNPIEWMDLVIRPATLALRLMMVITADELMRAAAILMVPVLLPTGVMAFELFIGVIQAFVFSLLTSIYIGLTLEHH
ncbi:MAG TPA: FoF1 ATP synthase subunit a [Candidatus Obscuribacterales bacterium]